MYPLTYLSEVLDHHLLLEGSWRSLCQDFPCIFRISIHHVSKATPEVVSGVCLTTWCWHLLDRTLEVLRNLILLLSEDFLLKLFTCLPLCKFCLLSISQRRIRTFRTEEVVDIISQDIRVGKHEVHCRTLFTCCFKHQRLVLSTLHLLDEGILNGTGIGVQKVGSFSTEVLKNFKTFVADLT